jgi:hypothetical protein
MMTLIRHVASSWFYIRPDKPFDLSESSFVPFVQRSHVQRKGGAVAKGERGCRSRSPREPPFTSYGTYSWATRVKGVILYVLRRVGSMSVCSDGAVAPGAEPAHGLAHSLEVEMSAVLLLQRSQMTRTRGTTTTSSVFYTQTTGVSVPVARDHEASMALMQTCRSSG